SAGVNYYGYTAGTTKIWDVTDASAGEAGVPMSDFSSNNWNMSLILDTNGKVRTAFVWEYDGTTIPGGSGHRHNFDWRGLTYQPVYGSASSWTTVGQIQDELEAGNNVSLRANLDIGTDNISSLYIPEGRTLRIQGNFDTSGMRVYGGGNLWVE